MAAEREIISQKKTMPFVCAENETQKEQRQRWI